ncbi:hypothetical protein AB3Y40_17840 [Yoonia sp. R2331]|uniref:hypothetical protein n=1 Tax=Yoonia sp. R2331 TaxID=3237238 RepID=UPI0034E6030C
MSFINQNDFNDPQSLMRARGVDPNPDRAFTDLDGKPLFHAQTGGILNPRRAELAKGTVLFRFGGGGAAVPALMAGCWWVDQREFQKLLSFGNQHNIPAGAAMRQLALIPPEWSDMTRLVRVTVKRALLAYRGLGNSVHIDTGDGLGVVNMPHQNDNPARRMQQLYIPGLWRPGAANAALSYGSDFSFDADQSMRGFLYL